MVGCIEAQRDRTLVAFAPASGLRASELGAVTIGDQVVVRHKLRTDMLGKQKTYHLKAWTFRGLAPIRTMTVTLLIDSEARYLKPTSRKMPKANNNNRPRPFQDRFMIEID